MLGKLPMLPIVSASCATTVRESIFRGDPGSVFIVTCPSGCAGAGKIYGSGIYTDDSTICMAAIHNGVI